MRKTKRGIEDAMQRDRYAKTKNQIIAYRIREVQSQDIENSTMRLLEEVIHPNAENTITNTSNHQISINNT